MDEKDYPFYFAVPRSASRASRQQVPQHLAEAFGAVGRIAAPYPPIDGTQPCASEDPELFFTNSKNGAGAKSTDHATLAIRLCRTCPFRRPCLAYALTHLVEGVWGATTRYEREQMRNKHGIAAELLTIRDVDVQRLDPELLGGGSSSATNPAPLDLATPDLTAQPEGAHA